MFGEPDQEVEDVLTGLRLLEAPHGLRADLEPVPDRHLCSVAGGLCCFLPLFHLLKTQQSHLVGPRG